MTTPENRRESAAAKVDLEVKTEHDRIVWPEPSDALRISYRLRGSRRWTHFLVVPDEGQTLDSLEGYAVEAASLHLKKALS